MLRRENTHPIIENDANNFLCFNSQVLLHSMLSFSGGCNGFKRVQDGYLLYSMVQNRNKVPSRP